MCPRIKIKIGSEEDSTLMKEKEPDQVALPVGGRNDERMSWGLQFSADRELSSFIKKDNPSAREVNLPVDDEEENRSVIDWGFPADP